MADATAKRVMQQGRPERIVSGQAFDEDVRLRATQESLDSDWVIDARKAYAAAIDAYAKTQAADERAAVERQRNLQAIDAALTRLQRWADARAER